MSEAPPRKSLAADGVLAVVTIFWGVTFVIVQDALRNADPLSFLALRFLVGAVAATLIAGRKMLHGPTLKAGLTLSVFLSSGFALQTFGLVDTTPSRSAFITGLSVVLVPLVSMALLRRAPRAPAWAGVALSVVGMYVLTGGFSSPAGAHELRGDLLTLGCALVFSFHILLTERYAPTVHPTAMVAVQLWVTSALCGLCVPFGSPRVVWTVGFAVALAVCGILASAVAISVQTWGQARTTAIRAALIFSLEPVFATLYSVLVGREALTWRTVWGGGLMLGGVVLAEVSTVLLDRWKRSRLGLISS